MRLYIAIGWGNLDYGKELARYFEQEGFEITSHYVAEDYEEAQVPDHEQAARDLQEIILADALIKVTGTGIAASTTGGRHTEFGIGMGLGKILMVLGDAENIFHALPGVHRVETPEQAVVKLRQLDTRRFNPGTGEDLPIWGFLDAVESRAAAAALRFGPTRSAHEGYGVLREEYLEVEAEVFKKAEVRDLDALREECVDLAAAAARLAVDICNTETEVR